MILKKRAKPAPKKKTRSTTWREALRQSLARVPGVDAVFVATTSETVHVYSIVKELREPNYKGLFEEEQRIEKKFPHIPFEFHTRAHQGRDPKESGPWGAELVYLR